MHPFPQGFIIGLSIAAPVGPIGLLCIRRSIAEGALTGLATGLGAAVADALYGAIAAFGLTAISSTLVQYQKPTSLIGGLFLLYLGWTTFRSKPKNTTDPKTSTTLASAFLTTCALTLTNPMTILSFGAVFAGFGLGRATSSMESATLMVTGVLLGSATWWLTLSFGVASLRSRIEDRHVAWINRFSGLLIAGFGLRALAEWLRT